MHELRCRKLRHRNRRYCIHGLHQLCGRFLLNFSELKLLVVCWWLLLTSIGLLEVLIYTSIVMLYCYLFIFIFQLHDLRGGFSGNGGFRGMLELRRRNIFSEFGLKYLRRLFRGLLFERERCNVL
jgi:hypothetical protein